LKISHLISIPSLIEFLKSNYEGFVIANYKLEHYGLYHDGDTIYAVVANYEENDTSLSEIQDLYDYKFRTLGIPGPVFINEIRKNFIKIDFRNIYEKVNLFGHPLNVAEFTNNLSIAINPKLHPFNVSIRFSDNSIEFTFRKEITKDELSELTLTCESLGYYGYNYIVNINHDLPDYKYKKEGKNTQGNLTLTACQYLKNNQPKQILDRYEEDQDFWSGNRVSVFSDINLTRNECLNNSFNNHQSKCFVDASVFPRNNIREYLSLYQIVIIAIPIIDTPRSENFYEIFKITRTELLELVKRGRVKFVAYQNLERYNSKFLADVLSVDSECVLFSRRLAAASLLAIRDKTGLFGYSFDSYTQYKIMKECYNSNINELKILAESLSKNIAFFEYKINSEGAMAVSQFCGANFINEIYKLRGHDFTIELMSSAMSLEFALGLDAHHFPFEHTSYSEVNACKIINGMYNGFQESNNELREAEIQTLLSNIFTINNDMNVLELDDILSNHNLRIIPEILKEYVNLTPEELSFKIYSLNKEIKKIENKMEHISILDVSGFAGAFMEYKGLPGAGYLALLPCIIKTLKAISHNSKILKSETIIKLESLALNAPRNAVLVNKIRKEIKK